MKKTILYLFSFVLCSSSYSQTLELDLSSIKHGETKLISSNKNLTIKKIDLINTVPAKKYTISYDLEISVIPPLNTAGFQTDKSKLPTPNLCSELSKLIEDTLVDSKISEKNVNQIKDKIREQIKNCKKLIDKDPEPYKNYLLAIEDSLKNIFHKLVPLPSEIKITTGDILNIKVSSGDSIWTFVLKGIEKGQWITTYGFSFTSKKSETHYYSKQSNDTSTFEIKKARQADFWDLNYIPGIFFSYFPTRNLNSFWNHSLTAGLGLNLSEPIIFFGYNGLFFQNIGISSGIAFQERYRLKDQFNENDIISLNLDKGQLHDKIYRPSLFLSINFRFSENPFKIKSSSENTNNDNN